MNYFELFEIPVTFEVQSALLKRTFYELSRKFHPDFHTSSEEQEKVLEKSTQINEAYRILSDENARMKYILSIFSDFEEKGNEALPQDFLMEMMDWNETLDDLEENPSENAKSALETEISAAESNFYLAVKPLIISYKVGDDLTEIKKYYLKKRYLLRMRERLFSFAPL